MQTHPEPAPAEEPQRPSRPADRKRTAWRVAVLAGLVLVTIGRSMIGTGLDGFTLDEPYHLLAGVAYAESGSYHLNPEHPPLVKRVAGEALAPLVDLPPVPRLRNKLQERNLAERLVFLAHDGYRLQERARGAMFLFHGAWLFVLLAMAWQVFGFGWSVVVGAWLSLDPTIAAHLPLAMTDLSLALGLGLTALVAARADTSRSWLWTAALGITFGLALATKHSALPGLLALGLFWLLATATRRDPAGAGPRARALRVAGRFLVVIFLAQGVLWSQYGFRFHAADDGTDPFHRPIDAKIEEIASEPHRRILRLADRLHLVPRAYLWGLADTIRAGIEGRGQTRHLLFGRSYEGPPPWYFWLGILAAKIPLGLWILTLCGAAALLARPPPPGSPQRAALLALGALAAAHYLALATSRATYGGIRHALPLTLVLAFLAGGIVQLRRSRWPKGAVLLPALLLLVTLATTLGEPRVWEYHNELAGGTRNAARLFDNEGVHLGQRLPEVAWAWHETLGAPDAPIYVLKPVVEEEARSLGLPVVPPVTSLYDRNVRGVYDGFFLLRAGWRRNGGIGDPEALAELEEVARLGNVVLLAGSVESPQIRASGLLTFVGEYLNRTRSPDWKALSERLEEILVVRPGSTASWILLGNSRVALRDRAGARTAFRAALESLHATDSYRSRLSRHLDAVESDRPLGELPFLPIPSAE